MLNSRTSKYPPLRWGVFVLVSLVASYLAFNLNDFHVLYSAAIAARSGINPYTVPMFVSPLAVLLYFIPVSFLPELLAFRVTVFLSTFVYCEVLYRASRHNWIIMAIAFTTPILLYNLFAVNVDWLLALATIVNPLAGFWLAMLKPQIGGVLAIILLVEIYRRYGWRVVALCCVGQAAVYLASFAMRDAVLPLESALGWTLNHAGNMSAWPWGLVLGIPLALVALRRSDRFAALAAGPLISPYVGPQSWSAVLPWLARHRVILVIVWIGSWLFVSR